MKRLLLVVVAPWLVHCRNVVYDPGDGADSAAEPGAGGGGVTAEGGGDPDAIPESDFFGCGFSVDCHINAGHLGSVDPVGEACAGRLLVAGDGGAFVVSSDPGPYPTSAESLYVIRPDGRVVVQNRSRCTTAGACGDPAGGTEWVVTAPSICDPAPEPDALAGCAAGATEGLCRWSGTLDDCEPFVASGCDDVGAAN